MSTRIAEPALWCLLTRLGENFEVFTNIINQERAWFFPGRGTSSHLLLASANGLSMPTNASRHYYRGLSSLPLICLGFDLNNGDICQVARKLRLAFKKLALLHTKNQISASWFFSSWRLLGISQQVTESDLRKKGWGWGGAGCTVWQLWLCTWAQHSLIYWNPTVKSYSKVTDSNFSLFYPHRKDT